MMLNQAGFSRFASLAIVLVTLLVLGLTTYYLSQKNNEDTLPTIKKTEIRGYPMITIKTNFGDITLKLDAEKAPKTVANFISYIEKGHYDGTIFHRVIPSFMIQGGGFAVGMTQKPVKAPIQNEANNGLVNNKYTVAMARTSDPHSATSQFFINTKDNDFLNFTSESPQGWGYAVFGEVVTGQEVIDKIEQVGTGNRNGHGDVPLEDVVIESMYVSK